MKKCLLIDGQLFQTSTWHRGMGKYSFELISVLSDGNFYDEFDHVEMILNQKLDLEPEREAFLRQICPEVSLTYLDLQNRHDHYDISNCQQVNRETLNQYIGQNHAKDHIDFLMLSLFEGDLAVPVFPEINGKKAMLFFDIIPYLFADQYLLAEAPRSNYFDRFNLIFESDVLFTISETTRNDLITFMGVLDERVVNIDGAPIELMREKVEPKRPKIDLSKPFILFPSGNDIRKNNERTVRAFAAFNERVDNKYQMLITSSFTDDVISKMRIICGDVHFTGNVSEPEIKWLYDNAEVVLFPSLYEGLGLPVLEAINSNKPIACSDITVFKEMSEDAFEYFDGYSILDIANGLASAILAKPDKKKYEKVIKKYNWKRTGNLFMQGWRKAESHRPDRDRLNIAILGPHPSGVSGIAKVMQLMHPTFDTIADIDYYLETNESSFRKASYLEKIASTYDVSEFNYNRYKQYDAVIYQIGNSDNHNRTVWFANRYPGYAIFHETKLSGLMNTSLHARTMSEERVAAEEQLDQYAGSTDSSFTSSIINNQLGVIMHSSFTRKAVQGVVSKEFAPEIIKANLPIPTPVATFSNSTKKIVGLAGILHPTKGLKKIEMLAQSQRFEDCIFRLFGFGFGATEEELATLRTLPNVEVIVDPTDVEYNALIASSDVILNYRPHYNGESSYTTLEAMRSGAAVIVRNIGWFAELPEGSVIKLDSEDQIEDALYELINDEKLQKRLSVAAQKAIENTYNYQRYTNSLMKLIKTKKNKTLPLAIRAAILHSKTPREASNQIRKLLMRAKAK